MRKLLLFFALLGSCGLFLYGYWTMCVSSYTCLSVRFVLFPDIPVIDICIQNKYYSMAVDSGNSSNILALHESALTDIKRKKEIKALSYFCNGQGRQYERRCFQVEDVWIGNVSLGSVIVGEDTYHSYVEWSDPWHQSGKIGRRVQQEWLALNGRVGLHFFLKGDFFFDFPHGRILCSTKQNSLSKLRNKIYRAQHAYVSVPFEQSPYGLSVIVNINGMPRKFILDTGANLSFLRTSLIDQQSVWEIAPGKRRYTAYGIEIGRYKCSKWDFWLCDLGEELEFDGILGVDFFKVHSLYFDLENKRLYLKRP